MAALYATTPQNITQHLRAIYDEGEQDPTATCKPYVQVRREGSRDVQRSVKHGNVACAQNPRESVDIRSETTGPGGDIRG